MKIFPLSLIAIVSFLMNACSGVSEGSYMPPNGFVSNSETAIQIAEAVLIPIYGKGKIHSERPFVASLKDGVWTVEGTLLEGLAGGTAHIEIAKKNARIISVFHGK